LYLYIKLFKTTAYIGNGAADFGETERTTIFSVELRRIVGEKNWSWRFALNFVSFVQAKENKEIQLSFNSNWAYLRQISHFIRKFASAWKKLN
jgi:hypothetical protein